ncbi:MAG: hypothetical protein IJ009_05730 [Clostridia bacterium]|nr:hypothetical protein [Clostridia bacterium]
MKKRILAMLLACVMLALAIPAVLPVTAAEANLFSETFDGAKDVEYSKNTRLIPNPTDIPFLFVWYNADGTPVPKKTVLTDDCYAVYNPVLIDAGVFSADEDFSTILEKYREHLNEYGQLSFAGNWSMVNMRFDGTRIGQINELTRAFMSQYGNIYGVYNRNGVGTTNECWEQFWVLPHAVRDALTKAMFEDYAPVYVEPGDDGKILYAEIKTTYASVVVPAYQTRHSELGSGANVLTDGTTGETGVLFAMPCPKSSTAYMYTVPELVVGEAVVSIDSITYSTLGAYTNAGKICLVYNKNDGQVNDTLAVWPEGAEFADPTTWADLDPADPDAASKITESLENVKLSVSAGDQISLCVNRSGSSIAVNIQPTITIDKECIVQFQDQDGNLLSTGGGKVGMPFPQAPYAAGEGGYLIDGVAATELPDTITGDMIVKYVGDVTVVDAVINRVSISVADSFALNVYFDADPYATKVGILDDEGEEVWADKQDDGSFKLSLPNLHAKDMDQEVVILTVQEFADGRQYDAAFEEEIVPTEVLASYADSDASDAEKALAVAALDYVAAAKAYFYGDVLESDVQARLATQDAAIAAIESNVKLADKNEYCINGVTLVLRDQVAFKVRVTLSEMNFIDEEALDYLISVEQGGTETEYEGFVYTEGDEELSMVMTLGGIAAADFDSVHKLTVKDGSFTVSDAFSYSVNDYIARTFDANAKEADLLRAIYALGVAANNA